MQCQQLLGIHKSLRTKTDSDSHTKVEKQSEETFSGHLTRELTHDCIWLTKEAIQERMSESVCDRMIKWVFITVLAEGPEI